MRYTDFVKFGVKYKGVNAPLGRISRIRAFSKGFLYSGFKQYYVKNNISTYFLRRKRVIYFIYKRLIRFSFI